MPVAVNVWLYSDWLIHVRVEKNIVSKYSSLKKQAS